MKGRLYYVIVERVFEDYYSYGWAPDSYEKSFENTVISNPDYYYKDCTFKNVSFNNDMTFTDFENCRFENCQFTNISLESVNFIDSELDRCNFSDSSLNVEIVNSRFSNNRFNRAVFSNDQSVHIPWSVGADGVEDSFKEDTQFLGVRDPIQNFDSEKYLSEVSPGAYLTTGSQPLGFTRQQAVSITIEPCTTEDLNNKQVDILVEWGINSTSFKGIDPETLLNFTQVFNSQFKQTRVSFDGIGENDQSFSIKFCWGDLGEGFAGVSLSGLAHGGLGKGLIIINPDYVHEQRYELMTHELLHSLGLWHPHDMASLKFNDNNEQYFHVPHVVSRMSYATNVTILDPGFMAPADLFALYDLFGRNESSCANQFVNLSTIQSVGALDLSGHGNVISAADHEGYAVLNGNSAFKRASREYSLENLSLLVGEESNASFLSVDANELVLEGSTGGTLFIPGEQSRIIARKESEIGNLFCVGAGASCLIHGFNPNSDQFVGLSTVVSIAITREILAEELPTAYRDQVDASQTFTKVELQSRSESGEILQETIYLEGDYDRERLASCFIPIRELDVSKLPEIVARALQSDEFSRATTITSSPTTTVQTTPTTTVTTSQTTSKTSTPTTTVQTTPTTTVSTSQTTSKTTTQTTTVSTSPTTSASSSPSTTITTSPTTSKTTTQTTTVSTSPTTSASSSPSTTITTSPTTSKTTTQTTSTSPTTSASSSPSTTITTSPTTSKTTTQTTSVSSSQTSTVTTTKSTTVTTTVTRTQTSTPSTSQTSTQTSSKSTSPSSTATSTPTTQLLLQRSQKQLLQPSRQPIHRLQAQTKSFLRTQTAIQTTWLCLFH